MRLPAEPWARRGGDRRGKGERLRAYTHREFDATRPWLRDLRVEAEHEAQRHGPMRGRLLPVQRKWSRVIDSIEQAEQEAAA